MNSEDIARELAIDLSETPRAPLYHYCDASAVLGIVKGGEIWATHIGYLNDATELDAAEKLAIDALREALPDMPAALAAGTHLRDINSRHAPSARYDHYVFSLSEQSDLLSQWRGYAKDGSGFAIGFGGFPLIPRHWPDTLNQPLGVQIHRCTYERDEFRAKLVTLFREVQDRARRLELNTDAAQPMLVDALLHVIYTLTPTLKDAAFREEREWRLVVTVDQTGKVEFRPSSRGLIPYVRVPIGSPDSTTGICRIVVGPAQDHLLGLDSVRLFLRSEGYDPDLAQQSKAPYRTSPAK